MNKTEFEVIENFEDWYTQTPSISPQTGAMVPAPFSQCAIRKHRQFRDFKMEHDARVAGYEKYEKQAAAEVVSEKADLPNISSGESSGFVRRIARNVVQHTPNVFIANEFDEDSIPGTLARHILRSKVIGDDQYSNDMQQNLVTSARRAFTLGFDTVIPLLQQDAKGSWYIQYDTIHYRDVFPEPGAKDVRRAKEVYVRRYLTRQQIAAIIRDQTPGWDIAALRYLASTRPQRREYVDHEKKKSRTNPEAYEVITWYNAYGDPFLTFHESSKVLLRIEVNKHPLKEHPVFFYVPERDDQQPLGKSLLSLTFGRQEFQDLYMNGAMKMFYRNINPPIIGYGAVNAMPNMSPGKYTPISNPNAKLEAFTVDSQSLMMFGQISNQNQAAMVSMLGAADQQMAAQNTGGMMSQTPQGVEAQQQMVDITTNNYQKAMEQFFSRYCSYALTIYFQELKGTSKIKVTADARKAMIDDGMPPEAFLHEAREVVDESDPTVKKKIAADGTGLKDGELKIDFSDMATMYYVQCVPGSLVELEDEKQLRILKEIFVPLSQAMPAIAQAGDQQTLANASAAMQYIVKKTIELSGSAHSHELKDIFDGETDRSKDLANRVELLESGIGGVQSSYVTDSDINVDVLEKMQQQLDVMKEGIQALLGGRAAAAQGGQAAPEPPALAPGAGARGYSDAPAPQGQSLPPAAPIPA